MRVWWNSFGTLFSCFLVLVLVSEIREGWSLNAEGLALLQFRGRVDHDSHDALTNWNPNDGDPCSWTGVYCNDSKVQKLNLSSLSLGGTLAPEIGQLSHLRSLVLYKNRFYGPIPKEVGGLAKLELLDLRGNNLSGTVPAEIGKMPSLKRLLLSGNKFDESGTSAVPSGVGCKNKKFASSTQQASLAKLNKADSLAIQIKGVLTRYLKALPLFMFGKHSRQGCTESLCHISSSSEPHVIQNVHFVRRRLLEESSNIPSTTAPRTAAKLSSALIIVLPTSRSSGTFPAVSNAKKASSTSVPVQETNREPLDEDKSGTSIWERYGKYFIIFLAVDLLLIIGAVTVIMFRRRGMTAIRPWKTGLSGQLQKAFITGVPKLNQPELDIACEDFSNIIETLDGCTIYKGTLSSGVEIAVASTGVKSYKDWSNCSEKAFWKKIATLSRVNHKNFVNLIGYCDENEPFTRMMVFEYAPNGSLFEHLHFEEVEHDLDWSARMRIIMGTAYYLQYIHHDLNPPIVHSDLNSRNIYLTDDYAAKISDIIFSPKCKSKPKISSEEEHSVYQPLADDTKANVYSFGMLMLETISGKLPYSEEQGSLVDWAAKYLSDKKSIGFMTDPTLKSFENNELDIICEVIQDCIKPEPKHRPTMKEVVSKLREVLSFSPDQVVPRLSPLWWAELEILSGEAT